MPASAGTRLQARQLAPRVARAAGPCFHVQRHLLGTRTARDARLFGPARRRPARFIGKRRAAKRHKIGRAVGCRRASAGHGSCAGHSRLKRPPMASLAAHMRCAKVGRNDTIPLRRFWCNTHTPLASMRCDLGTTSNCYSHATMHLQGLEGDVGHVWCAWGPAVWLSTALIHSPRKRKFQTVF